MQVKIYTIPIIGGESLNDEMNVFLRSKKILQVENQVITTGQNAFWSFCIKYIEDATIAERERVKVDYRQVLDEATFQRFSKLRELRKQLAQDEGVPAYAVFTDEELSNIAKLEVITVAAMKKIKGIGDKKVEKYGHHFVKIKTDEKSE